MHRVIELLERKLASTGCVAQAADDHIGRLTEELAQASDRLQQARLLGDELSAALDVLRGTGMVEASNVVSLAPYLGRGEVH